MDKKKTAPVVGAEPVIISGPTPCSNADSHRHILRCLLHYHERMMMLHEQCPGGHCDTATKAGMPEGVCVKKLLWDPYAEALKEAIRCIEIVHKGEFTE